MRGCPAFFHSFMVGPGKPARPFYSPSDLVHLGRNCGSPLSIQRMKSLISFSVHPAARNPKIMRDASCMVILFFLLSLGMAPLYHGISHLSSLFFTFSKKYFFRGEERPPDRRKCRPNDQPLPIYCMGRTGQPAAPQGHIQHDMQAPQGRTAHTAPADRAQINITFLSSPLDIGVILCYHSF